MALAVESSLRSYFAVFANDDRIEPGSIYMTILPHPYVLFYDDFTGSINPKAAIDSYIRSDFHIHKAQNESSVAKAGGR